MSNFRYRGRVFTRGLLEAIKPGMWSWMTERQDYEGSAHKDTESIILRGPAGELIDQPFDCIQAGDYWAADVLRPHYDDVLDQVQQLVPWSELGRVMIVKLRPGGRITPHVDEGAYAEHYTTRLHVAMTNTLGAWLTVGGEACTFVQHTCWQFNHRVMHEAHNGPIMADRIHLILDVVEKGDSDDRDRERERDHAVRYGTATGRANAQLG